jgi:hypothetical protein
MIQRRNLLLTSVFAPVVIASTNLMRLSWRSSELLAYAPWTLRCRKGSEWDKTWFDMEGRQVRVETY